jgi:arthrofactin-type cyclic lipopeptide synthetase C
VEFLGLFDTTHRVGARRDVASDDHHLDRVVLYDRALAEYSAAALPIAVHLFPAQDDTHVEARRGWNALLPDARLRVTPVPGAHLTMMQPAHVGALGRAVTLALHEGDYSP